MRLPVPPGAPPAVLVGHCYYRERGGEDVSFEAEVALLKAHGHPTTPITRRNMEIHTDTLYGTLRVIAETFWSASARRQVSQAIRRNRPAIAYFKNIFPRLSPSVYDACHREGIPVVQTLHNYRLICPKAVLYRHGRTCRDCVRLRVPWPSVRHACYRDSTAATAVIATSNAFHLARGTWRRDVDAYITPTAFARGQIAEGGLPQDRILVKPNFVEDPGTPHPVPLDGPVLYIGRLTEDKGVGDILDAMRLLQHPRDLRIIGTGPDEERFRDHSPPRTRFVGAISGDAVLREIQRAAVIVVPSRLLETFGRVAAEAFACGRPVLGSRHGALGEIIEHGRTGLLFQAADPGSIAAALDTLFRNPALHRDLAKEARLVYERRYTPERNYRMLMGIYRLAFSLRFARENPWFAQFPRADPHRSPFDWVEDPP